MTGSSGHPRFEYGDARVRTREPKSPAADLSALLGCRRPNRRDGSARHIQMASAVSARGFIGAFADQGSMTRRRRP